MRTQAPFRERFTGVVGVAHALGRGKLTAARLAAGRHGAVSRGSTPQGPVDEALTARGLRRDIVVTVAGIAEALTLARACDLIATVPGAAYHPSAQRAAELGLPLAL